MLRAARTGDPGPVSLGLRLGRDARVSGSKGWIARTRETRTARRVLREAVQGIDLDGEPDRKDGAHRALDKHSRGQMPAQQELSMQGHSAGLECRPKGSSGKCTLRKL